MSDTNETVNPPELTPSPEAGVDRRALLRGILGSAVAVGAVATSIGTPSLARAAAVPATCSTVDFHVREAEMKKDQSIRQPKKKTMEEDKKQKQQIKQARYAMSGPAPVTIDVDGLYELEAEMEQSSVVTTEGAVCGVTMDLYVDVLGTRTSIKDAVAAYQKLLPPAPGKESPFLAVTWGAEGDQAFEGFLEKIDVAYVASTPDGTPVRALLRASFLLL